MKARLLVLVCVLSLLVGFPVASFGQGAYFGRNKVQWHDFDFQVLKTEHFDIYFYPQEEEAARAAARMGERW